MYYGANTHSTTNLFADLKADKLNWARVDFCWAWVEATQGTYDFTITDNIVRAANAQGVQLSVILESPPAWATTNGVLKSSCYQNFVNFAVAVVRRYSPQGVKTYEIFNEANCGATFAIFSGHPSIYAGLLKSTYLAMKSADPSITVLMTSLADLQPDDATHSNAVTFLNHVYTAIGSGYFDAANYHPYSWNTNEMNGLYAQMQASGEGNKKIWFTEYGAPTNGTTGQYFVTEEQQASLIASAITNVKNIPYAAALFFYDYQDDLARQPDREGYFGIIRNDLHKPSWNTIQSALS